MNTLKKQAAKRNRHTMLVGILFILPMIAGILLFYYIPMLQAFIYSLQNTSGMGTGTFVGLYNYKKVLGDDQFWTAMYNTVYMGILSVALNTIIPFVLASMINSMRATKNLFKSIFFVPNVVSIVAASVLFKFMFYPTKEGLINSLLVTLGMEPLGWFADPAISKLTICLMGLWRCLGYNIIIFIAGLQSVPNELYEAANVDGVSPLKRWWYITVPLVKPIIFFVVMMDTISAMRRFGDVWMIGGTGGSPGGSLLSVVVYIYRYAFSSNQMGVGCAASYILFVIIMTLTCINYIVSNRNQDY